MSFDLSGLQSIEDHIKDSAASFAAESQQLINAKLAEHEQIASALRSLKDKCDAALADVEASARRLHDVIADHV